VNLTRQAPRRPSNTRVSGMVGMARMADKARASDNGTIGEHLYGSNSGLDRILLEYLGVSADDFEEEATSRDDEALGDWILEISGKSQADIDAFNRHHFKKEPADEGGKERLRKRVERFAPGRTDITTTFQSIELDDLGTFREATDLNARAPRTPYDRSVGQACALARMADKGRADRAGKLNDYIYNCPIDQIVMEFLGLSAEAFQEAAWDHLNDSELGDWVIGKTSRTPEDISAFNVSLIHKGPESDEEIEVFRSALERSAPGRTNITTWFDLLDTDDEVSYGSADLTRHPPRSPYDRSIMGAVGVARIVDKGRAYLGGTLGDYWYGHESGADKGALKGLGTSVDHFEQALRERSTDEAMETWLREACPLTQKEIEAYNEEMVRRGPSNEGVWKWYRGFVAGFDPSRKDLTTFYQIMEYHDHIEFAKLHSGI
jgi:hypothetical protein